MYRINLFILILLTALIIPSCSKKEGKNLVGQWEPVERPYNLGTKIIFGEDSSYTQIKEARIDYKYELVGDTLISTSFNGFTGEVIVDSANITISRDTLILVRGKTGDQQETIMTRYDSVYTAKEEIIGFWKWPHQSGKDAISEYHPDGKAAVSVLIEHREGYYFINSDSLTVVMPGTTLRDIYFEVKGDTLFFPDTKYAPLGQKLYRVKNKE